MRKIRYIIYMICLGIFLTSCSTKAIPISANDFGPLAVYQDVVKDRILEKADLNLYFIFYKWNSDDTLTFQELFMNFEEECKAWNVNYCIKDKAAYITRQKTGMVNLLPIDFQEPSAEKILSILKKEVKEMEGIKYVVISKSHNVYDDRGERWQLEVFNSDINEMSKIFSVEPLYYTTMYTTIS